jgi:peptidoglycan/LPS O-acetylase OafA/YrhL
MLGSLGAYFSFFSDRFISFFKKLSRVKIVMVYLMGAVVFFAFGFNNFFINYSNIFQVLDAFFLGLFFTFIILEQNYSDHSFFKMKGFTNITKLGKYTYALYSFHLIAIYFTVFIFKSASIHNNNIANPFVYLIEFIASLMLAIFISIISYNYYERYFLRLKSKFVVIK